MSIIGKRWDDHHYDGPPPKGWTPGVFDRDKWDREAPAAAAEVDAGCEAFGEALALLLFPKERL